MSLDQYFYKRIFEILFSLFGIIIVFIPGIFITMLIKISSPGPVFFVQKRIGRYGRYFVCVKFRTMYANSSDKGTITTSKDTRITKIGTFLRRFKLDELPQLWNVLIGKMSFVGPRPDVAGYADTLTGESRKILELRPGITGPASLYFRDEEKLLASVENAKEFNDTIIWPKKVQLNLEYYYHWSFWKDIGYILITVIPMLNRWLRLVEDQSVELLNRKTLN